MSLPTLNNDIVGLRYDYRLNTMIGVDLHGFVIDRGYALTQYPGNVLHPVKLYIRNLMYTRLHEYSSIAV